MHMTTGRAVSAIFGGFLIAMVLTGLLAVILPFERPSDRLVIGSLSLPISWTCIAFYFCLT